MTYKKYMTDPEICDELKREIGRIGGELELVEQAIKNPPIKPAKRVPSGYTKRDAMLAEMLERITIADVLRRYGYSEGKRGRCPCPVHDGRDNNMAYTDLRFRCFVCGAHGNIFDLAMGMFKLDFRGALDKLAWDLGFSPVELPPGREQEIRERKEAKAREREELSRQREEIVWQIHMLSAERRAWFLCEGDERLWGAAAHIAELDTEIDALELILKNLGGKA